jgi:hypothetical protein
MQRLSAVIRITRLVFKIVSDYLVYTDKEVS